jgi:PelA/Pel-15E family pectate lyase
MKADRAALTAERQGLTQLPQPPTEHAHDNSMPLDRGPAWYATPKARHVADNVVSFQTPAGGWGKNQDRSGPLRQRGQDYVPNNNSQFLQRGDFDAAVDSHWSYVGTLDNNATSTELRFLALVSKALPGKDGDAYRASFVKGIRYLLDAQYPNGGWPQVWPLQGGYHDAITYNDNAVTQAAELMTAIVENKDGDYGFVPADLRAKAALSAKRALDCILATQVHENGRPTIWGQQYDPLTLKPEAARNFEPAALSTDESADLLVYLMSLPDPSPKVVAAVHDGAEWLMTVTIKDHAWTGTPEGRRLVEQPGGKSLWARFYEGGNKLAVFGDRDKSIHNDVNELSLERRNGYAWFVTSPAKALKRYDAWSKAHPLPGG